MQETLVYWSLLGARNTSPFLFPHTFSRFKTVHTVAATLELRAETASVVSQSWLTLASVWYPGSLVAHGHLPHLLASVSLPCGKECRPIPVCLYSPLLKSELKSTRQFFISLWPPSNTSALSREQHVLDHLLSDTANVAEWKTTLTVSTTFFLQYSNHKIFFSGFYLFLFQSDREISSLQT